MRLCLRYPRAQSSIPGTEPCQELAYTRRQSGIQSGDGCLSEGERHKGLQQVFTARGLFEPRHLLQGGWHAQMPGVSRVDDERNAAAMKFAGELRGWAILDHEVEDDKLGSAALQPELRLRNRGHGVHLKASILKISLDGHVDESLILNDQAVRGNGCVRQHGPNL